MTRRSAARVVWTATLAAATAVATTGCLFSGTDGVDAAYAERDKATAALLGALDDIGDPAPDGTSGSWIACSTLPVAGVQFSAAAWFLVDDPAALMITLQSRLEGEGWETTASGDTPEVYRDLAKGDATLRFRLARTDPRELTASVKGECTTIDSEDRSEFDTVNPSELR